ncbi:MAG: U32 family peptidase [Firmicutes bacterium]|nr:U32 family peptidase [Bacillota bacterium]
MKSIELLAPAGDPEKLKIAIRYGADAVYFGGRSFSLRAGAGGMSLPEIRECVAYAHERGVRCHMTLNIYAHNEDLQPLREYIKELSDIPIDAFIVSDPAVIQLLQEYAPEAELHLSTQANTTNYLAARFWYDLGIRRLVLARELSLEEIARIRGEIPEDMELEAFAHGAMCISYSGRCLLSNFMTGRDANRGACAHPCRYKYRLEEEKRPGEYWPVEEDARGTYIFNSNDLCMLEHIGDLAKAGVTSLKIEGRMKSIFYIAHVIGAYRRAIDAYEAGEPFDPAWMEEMMKASHRNFTTGFYYHEPGAEDQNYSSSAYSRDYAFVGLVQDFDPETGLAVVEQRNKMVLGDTIEVFGPGQSGFTQRISEMYDEEGEPLESAPHPQQILKMRMMQPVSSGWMLRKKQSKE